MNSSARWYDPEVGRWLSEDPIGFEAGDANLYRYVGNGVTLDTDPSGLARPITTRPLANSEGAVDLSPKDTRRFESYVKSRLMGHPAHMTWKEKIRMHIGLIPRHDYLTIDLDVTEAHWEQYWGDYVKYRDGVKAIDREVEIASWLPGPGMVGVKVPPGIKNSPSQTTFSFMDDVGNSVPPRPNVVQVKPRPAPRPTQTQTTFSFVTEDTIPAGHRLRDWYPPNRGFIADPEKITLPKGSRFDRYGPNRGYFAAPEGTPYEMRSLSPEKGRPYKVFEVLEPIEVDRGLTAPWFGQPGLGVQYELPDRISTMISEGLIRELK